MLSRLSYILRETGASLTRNITLTLAAIITTAVALLIFGLTLFVQQGFDNLLFEFEEGVEVMIFVAPDAEEAQIAEIRQALDMQPSIVADWEYCDKPCALTKADQIYASDPTARSILTAENIPSYFDVIPVNPGSYEELKAMTDGFRELPGVTNARFAEEEIRDLSQLRDFTSRYSVAISVLLLFAAVLLIWNTIRTAMFARRREIEVMKLVGATDWFIRLPFMIEGLVQGFVGGVTASAGLYFINNRWTAGLHNFDSTSQFRKLVVDNQFMLQRSVVLVVIGMVAGAIGAGIAASRFLDV